jgi:hypothetical protein
MHTNITQRLSNNPSVLSRGFFHGQKDCRLCKRKNYAQGGKNSKRVTLRTHRIGK